MNNRYEIKFVLNELEYSEACYFLKFINSFKPYPSRRVNSLYFDTYDYSSIKDNISGISNRKKIRLRWYNEFEKPSLEIKNKFSRVGNKKTHKIDFIEKQIFKNSTSNELSKLIFKNSKIKESLIENTFVPTLKVSYIREYFETKKGIRITIDKEIKFSQVLPNKPINFFKEIKSGNRVMELKFPIELKPYVNDLIRNLNLTPKRNSKYLLGMSKLGYVNYV
jgi:hypothetical protein